MNKLGYSFLINEKNSEKLHSLNKSIENLMKNDDILKQFESIDFAIEGNTSEKSLRLLVNYKTKDGRDGVEIFSSHIDEGAIEIPESFILAYFDSERYESIKEELDSHYGVFDADYLIKNEPDLYNQLAEDYLLNCSPDVEGGSEFTKEDKQFFNKILDKEIKFPYDAKVELNEYIEKWSEIQPQLDQICENINNERVLVTNNGCDEYLVRKVVGYLENHGLKVQFN